MRIQIRYAPLWAIVLSVFLLSFPFSTRAQDAEVKESDRESLIQVAKGIMESVDYCALITLDKSGHPKARTMDPFAPDEDMKVWLGTNINSRKVGEIRADSRVTLYYEAPDGGGYVVLQGNAELIDNPENIEKYWKNEWEEFYPDKNSNFILIRVDPKILEIISYKHGITGSSLTWAVPCIKF